MQRVKKELKILGINPVLILLLMTAAFASLSIFGGDLLYLSDIGFEVVFPIFTAIAVSEWGKIKTDDNFEMIAAQSRSLFQWILYRAIVIFAEVAVFALAAMVLVSALRQEMPVSEMLLRYLSPAFFLSTVSVLFGICFSQEHIATLCCGMMWLFVLMARSLLRISGVEYFYLFICYAGDANGIWLVNKVILCAVSLLLWRVIFGICRKKG